MTRTLRLGVSLLWVANFVFLAGGNSSTRAQELKKLKVGTIPISALLSLFAAVENGNFKQEGIDLELNPMVGGAVIIPAVVGGSLDVGFSAYFSVFAARDQGLNIVIIAAGNSESGPPVPYGHHIMVRADSNIIKAKDLEGKKYALNVIKSLDWVVASEWLSRNGADPKKVIWVELPFPSQVPALRAKQVDALSGVDPWLSIELDRGEIRVIAAVYSEIDPKMPIAGYIATEPWVKRNQTTVERFARAVRAGADYLSKNPEKRGEILVKYTQIKPEWAKSLRFYPAFDLVIDAAALQRSADLALKWGLISKKLDVTKIALPGLLR